MFALVVHRVGASQRDPLAYGPFDTEADAEREWGRLEGMRSLFDDLLQHHVVPLQQASDRTPEPVRQPHVYPQPVIIQPYWNPSTPVWVWPNFSYPYRVTWSSGAAYVDGVIGS